MAEFFARCQTLPSSSSVSTRSRDFWGGFLIPDARRGFEIAGDAPIEKRADVFEGVGAFARSFDGVEGFHDVSVRYLVERLCP